MPLGEWCYSIPLNRAPVDNAMQDPLSIYDLNRMNCRSFMTIAWAFRGTARITNRFRSNKPWSFALPESALRREVFKRSGKSVEGMTESLAFLEPRRRRSRIAAAAEQ